MEKTTLGQALVERRTSLEIDKATAARMIGVARSTYTAYELDIRRIAPESLPALGTFLDVSLDDLVHLYGATCMAQARETLLHHMFHSDPPVVEVLPVTPSLSSRTKRDLDDTDRDLSVLKRVFFDVVTTSGHEIAPAFMSAPASASASPTTASPASSIFEHHDEVTLLLDPRKEKEKEKEGKGKRKSKEKDKRKKNSKTKEKEKKKGSKDKKRPKNKSKK